MSLTDADLTTGRPVGPVAPVAPAHREGWVRAWWRDAADRLLGSDPGLTQLRTALQAVLGMALAVALAWLLVRTTGALGAPDGSLPPALLAAERHGMLVVALLLGAMPAMLAGFVVNDPTPRAQLGTSVLLPLPMAAAMGGAVLLDGWHAVSLAYLVVVLVAGVYLRRFGPHGFAAGMVAFQGAFLGYFVGPEIPTSQLGWVVVLLYLGVGASLAVRFTLFRPDNARTLARMQRSWRARARRLLGLALALTEPGADHDRLAARVGRQVTRLTESTLIIDGQLAQPEASPTAAAVHQQLFDLDLATTNAARFVVALTDRPLRPPLLAAVRAALLALHDDDRAAVARALADLRTQRPDDATTAVLVDRFVQSVAGLVVADVDLHRTARLPEPDPFTPAVGLFGGFLPGSIPVADAAGSRPGRFGRLDRAVMPAYVRAAIQIAVAATIAVVVGGLVDPRRLYWALLATFLAFLATSNTGEQVRKALFRMGGTAVGIVVGDVAVHLVGGNVVASLAIVLVALFFGIYLIRVNYMFMVVGITVAMSQLYVQLDEFSWSLLLLRLLETGVGVAAVVLTVLVVVPLRPQRVLTAGVLLFHRALRTVVAHALSTVAGGEPVTRADVRELDAAHHALVTTARPLRRAVYGRNSSQLAELLAVAAAVRNYARNLAVGAAPWPEGPARERLAAAGAQLLASLDVVDARLDAGSCGTYVRSAALVDLVDRALPRDASGAAELLLRDLMLVDGAVARTAAALGLAVTDHDTAAELPAAAGPHRDGAARR